MRLLSSLVLFILLTGCQYDRSFLNMNSDNGVPFLGLQMSVDASESSQKNKAEDVPVHWAAGSEDESSFLLASEIMRAQSPEWASSASSTASMTPENFLSPILDVSEDADPLTTVGRRLTAF
jgi:hypothetical protein